jgi:hypothetical protein
MVCFDCNAVYEPGVNASEVERESGFCPDCWVKPFPITSVCRADLADRFTAAQIARFDEGEMLYLARKMADAYCDSCFWQDMEIIAEHILGA